MVILKNSVERGPNRAEQLQSETFSQKPRVPP